MAILRTLAKWTGLALAAVLVLLALAFGAIQTPPGKALLERVGSALASSNGLRVEVSGITGFVPATMAVARIQLSDARGPFAEVENLSLDWNPLSLLFGTLDINAAGATRVALQRKPELPPAPPEIQSTSGGGFALPVRVGRFFLDEIVIDEPVLGHAAVLSLVATAELRALERGLSAAFNLKRRDQPGSLTGRLGYVPQTEHLDLDITAEEPAGGLVARAAGIADLPAITATLKGVGPLDAWDGRLDVAAGTAAKVNGSAQVRATGAGRRVSFTAEADIARLLPAQIAPLLEGGVELAGAATIDKARRIAIESATARSAGFGAGVHGTVDADAMTADLVFGLKAGEAARFAALAPGVTWKAAAVDGTLKGAFAAPVLSARATAEGLKGAGYGAATVEINAATLPDAARNLAFTLDGAADGLSADDPKVAQALGRTARFHVAGAQPKGRAAAVTGATVELAALTSRFSGTASAEKIAGTLKLEKLDLAAFSPLVGRRLAGTAALDATLDASGDLSRVDAAITGGTKDVATGIAAVDGLFGGTTTLAAKLARDGQNAIRVDRFNLASDSLTVTADGTISRARADLAAKLALADVAKLDPRVTGAVTGEAAFRGSLDNLGLTARLLMPAGTAMKQKVEGLSLAVTASDLTGNPAAQFTLDGRVAGKPATGSGAFATLADGAKQLKDLAIAIGSVSAKGDVRLDGRGLADGTLAVEAGDLNDLSPLALTELAGRLNADVRLDATGGRQRVAVKADAANVSAAGQSVGSARIDATVVDPTGAPVLDGTVRLRAVNAGGMDISQADLTAKGAAAGTSLNLDAVVNGATLTTAGLLTPRDGTIGFRLDRLNLARSGTSITNAAPANFRWSGDTLAIDRLTLTTRGGSASVSGRAGAALALDVTLTILPLALADLAAPGLGLSGTLSGSARLDGPAAAPTGTYSLTMARVSTRDLSANGIGPLDVRADGRFADGRVSTRTTVTGRFLSDVTLTGSAPLGAGELDLAIRGALDLGLANPMLATSGAQVRGRAAIDATVRGTAAAPRAGGTVRISGARFDDGVNGVNLSNIEGVITGTDRSVTLSSLTARTPNGGSLSARGTVALEPAQGFPGRIDVDLTNAGLVNSDLMRLVAEGRLAVEGAFANNPRLTGRLVVRHLDVNIPDRLPGGGAALNVRHVNGGRNWNVTTNRPGTKAGANAPRRSNAGMALDLTVSAPNNVFVRGMGLEAELGGDLKVGGTTASPATLGGFEMRRGTFDVLGRRLNFTRGKITFNGTTDPDLDFVAETTANDITAQILVTGAASRPDVTFSSTPTLPQDEVLSRLMFGRSAGSLTGAQALQIAQTIAQFSGGSGVLDQMRRSLGVDSLDVGTNAAGTGGQVGIGRRLNDRMYLGVRQGTTPGSSQVTVDMDITKNIRLQGATGADGSAEVGIGAQWDY
ncbi:translocation/assembly module TamB domain-containing protein [Xanthobacter autotrophicus]|uniref:translocation/assembly module TamB domain-containing protein n=1 Tax=Xanthobacter autotrophicus TaxID=280 RepID=UPI0024A6C7FD|nr:translocation/assembly module TamB domain-containing protein [Xanthobacter autotrophicus]MDI4657983.1 translocation/assembly module TamB domain-containing protein [Xanthobacter autotrophicus]